MSPILIGVTDVKPVALTLAPLKRERMIFNCCGFQHWDAAPAWIGEKAMSTAAGVTYDDQGRPVLDIDAAIEFVRSVPASVRLFSWDIEGNVKFPSPGYTRAVRLLHREVLKIRPDAIFCQYAEQCNLPGWDQYPDWPQKLADLQSDEGVQARGHSDAQHIIAGQMYPNAATTDDEIDRHVAVMVQTACEIAKPSQVPGLWTTPADLFTTPPGTPEGHNRSTPLHWKRTARIANRARIEGAKALLWWLYESQHVDVATWTATPWEEVFPQTYQDPLMAGNAAF